MLPACAKMHTVKQDFFEVHSGLLLVEEGGAPTSCSGKGSAMMMHIELHRLHEEIFIKLKTRNPQTIFVHSKFATSTLLPLLP